MFTASSGMTAQDLRIDVVANNLANVNTTGFKSQRANFQDVLYQEVRQVGTVATQNTTIPSGIQVGLGVDVVATQRLFTQGSIEQTNREGDLALMGEGFFQVVIDENGTVGYTRDGTFSIDSQTGNFVTADGFRLADNLSIPQDKVALNVSQAGLVEVRIPGSNQLQQAGQITLARFLNSEGLLAVGDNLFVETPASGTPIVDQPTLNGMGKIVQKSLESSNVELVSELVNMIRAQRAFEINSEAIKASDDMMRTVGGLRR
jgi:flagellar basal-body rod protein FlgG